GSGKVSDPHALLGLLMMLLVRDQVRFPLLLFRPLLQRLLRTGEFLEHVLIDGARTATVDTWLIVLLFPAAFLYPALVDDLRPPSRDHQSGGEQEEQDGQCVAADYADLQGNGRRGQY